MAPALQTVIRPSPCCRGGELPVAKRPGITQNPPATAQAALLDGCYNELMRFVSKSRASQQVGAAPLVSPLCEHRRGQAIRPIRDKYRASLGLSSDVAHAGGRDTRWVVARIAESSAEDCETLLVHHVPPGAFSEDELDGLPHPVRRYLAKSIAPGTPLAGSARFAMRGSIKLGRRWVPFHGHELLSPHRGLVWAVRAAGLIAGSDRYVQGEGSMDWKLVGLVPVLHADGPDISRSAAGRVAGEAVWVPTALLPRFGVSWRVTDPHHIAASYQLDEREHEVHLVLDDYARIRSVALERWGDPDGTGKSELHPFGFEATGHLMFGGVTIPSAGRAGWFLGTGRWPESESFRFEISEYELVTEPSR